MMYRKKALFANTATFASPLAQTQPRISLVSNIFKLFGWRPRNGTGRLNLLTFDFFGI
jgi:hypothetical protein